MKAMTHDVRRGVGVSLLAAVAFGFSGTFASPLLDSGWSAATLVTARVLLAAAVLAVPAAFALRGRWGDLRRDVGLALGYGVVVVAFTQLSYYKAVSHMEVAVALLVEYAAPVAVLVWLWLRHGQRPGRLTTGGAVLAMVGLLLVIDVGGGGVNPAGIAWGLCAMLGCAAYFLLSARESHVPPVALACAGMVSGAVLLLAAGALGFVEVAASTDPVSFRSAEVPFWLPLLGVGVVATAVAYSLGIIGARLAGARLASFISLFEVVTALVVAWVLLGEAPGALQALGGLGILVGVVLVKLGEPVSAEPVVEEPTVRARPAASR
jgi:drug/metabolite transporter (DMT)-like permease